MVREGWFHHSCITATLNLRSNSHTKTPLCHVGLCYEYLTHPRIDAQFYQLELKNESPHRLLYCKNSHLQQQRNTFPLQMRVYSSLVEANMGVSCEPCCHCVVPKVWTTAYSSTSKPSREKKSAGTSCCESPTRSWRTWECPGSAIRSSYWRQWTYSVLW